MLFGVLWLLQHSACQSKLPMRAFFGLSAHSFFVYRLISTDFSLVLSPFQCHLLYTFVMKSIVITKFVNRMCSEIVISMP